MDNSSNECKKHCGCAALMLKEKNIGCFYICSHLDECFQKERHGPRELSILSDSYEKEIIAYCQQCKQKIQRLCPCFGDSLSERYFEEVKKLLTSPIPAVNREGFFLFPVCLYS